MSEESIARLKATMIKKYGSFENWRKHMSSVASMGGKSSKRYLSHKEAARIGRIGGLNRARNKELQLREQQDGETSETVNRTTVEKTTTD